MFGTAGKVIQCKAAVAWSPKTPLAIETIDVAPPKAHEVRVKMVSTSLCHSDIYFWNGNDPDFKFPCVLGHEGAGIVESVGEGVTTLVPGDHILPSVVPHCRECKYCKSSKTNICIKFNPVEMANDTAFSCGGKKIFQMVKTSTFSEYTVFKEIGVAKIDKSAPLEKVGLISCAIATGYGAVVKRAKVEPGSTVAVWGLGAVGLAVVMGCKVAGASRIIGVDINQEKFSLAAQFGTTECVNPKDYEKPIQEVLAEMTDGGLDYTFECIGNTKTMVSAYESCQVGWGVCVIVGLAPPTDDITTKPANLIFGKELKGVLLGGMKCRDDYPKLVDEYMAGKIKVDEFITGLLSIDQINDAFDIMLNPTSKSLRTVMSF